MKRLALALTATAVALTLTACGGSEPKPTPKADTQMSRCLEWLADNHPTDDTTATEICVKMIQKDPSVFKD